MAEMLYFTFWFVCQVNELEWFLTAGSYCQVAAHLQLLTVFLLKNLKRHHV